MVSDRLGAWLEMEIVGRGALLDPLVPDCTDSATPYNSRSLVLVSGPGRVFMTRGLACRWILVDGPFDRKFGVRLGRTPSASQSEDLCPTVESLSDKGTPRSRQATGTVPAFAEDNSSPEKASPKRKIAGGFSAAILRGSSGIKKRCWRPCKALGGHWGPILKNRIILRANVQQSICETAFSCRSRKIFVNF